MKKKVDKNVMNESCFIMNIPKPLNTYEGNHLINRPVPEDSKIPLQNSLTPPQSIANSPIKIKLENESSPHRSEDGDISNDKLSPPLSSLGPGAEIKGKICHPIPSSSRLEDGDSQDEASRSTPAGTSGGRLTFFKEGKLLLELSHRSEQGSWVQVKSKTYWPPPSTTTTTTTIQHPLRHDTPTPHSDDCSSINSSPWSSDHIRKQLGPRHRSKIWYSATTDHLFFLKGTSFVKTVRRKVRLRRNPSFKIVGPVNSLSLDLQPSSSNGSSVKDIKLNDRKQRLEKSVIKLKRKISLPPDEPISIHALFDRSDSANCDTTDLAFATPRKRYLRTLESDLDSQSRKKVHSSSNSVPFQAKHCDKHASSSSPSFHAPLKCAISSQNSSAYSIDSLLSDSESKKSESYLRTLLKPERHQRGSQAKHGAGKDRTVENVNHLKVERGGSPYLKERKEPNCDSKKGLPDRFDLNQDLTRFTSHPNFNSLYLTPYLDPRYMMLQSLSPAPSFLPSVSQPNDVASAVAAAAAVAGYPISPLHISALTGNTLLPGGIGAASYAPATSIASQLIRSPTPSRSSPLSVPHSPSPKLSPAPPPIPLSPHFNLAGSPRDAWTPSSFQNSPQKYPSTSSVSPPPQDVPLNLSKPKRK